MIPAIGQRWKYTQPDGRVSFIVEVIDYDELHGELSFIYKTHVVQNIAGFSSDYACSLKSEPGKFGWTWEYLSGQDRP